MRFVAYLPLGFTVLASAVLGSRGYRVRESILLRTLGAARGQILSSIVAEYVFTGAIASIAGAILGILASWGLSYYFFGTAISIAPLPVLAIILAVTGATMMAGALGAGVIRRPALEALRAEA
jgi:putative ABC transport system permease protein